jgi:hypothetical protein
VSFSLGLYGVDLLVVPAPPGSQGYEDLRPDATAVQLSEQLSVMVASIVDLVRIAEASEDRSRVPALRRVLELATTPRGAASANAA